MRRLAMTTVLALLAALVLAAVPAAAKQVDHALEMSFNGNDAPDGPFAFVFGLSVDNSAGPNSGDVYVATVKEGPPGEEEALVNRVYRVGEDGSYDGVTIDGSDTPQGSFSFVENTEAFVLGFNGIAADSSAGPNSGDVYVADLAHDVVHRFSGSGAYECQISGQPAPLATECDPGGSATPDGGFAPAAVAVNEATGEVLVSDAVHGVIDRFSPAGAYLGQIKDPNLTRPGALAIDSAGNVYALDTEFFFGESLVKFDSAGNFVAELSAGAIGVAVDPATDRLYVAKAAANGIEERSAGGETVLDTFADEAENLYPSLAVNRASGRLFAGSFNFATSRTDVYTPVTTVPDVSADPAIDVGETTATLSGDVDPDGGGDVVFCSFQYGPTVPFHETAPCDPAPPLTGPTHVGAELTGLEPSTTYHFKLSAANGGAPPYTKGVRGNSAELTFVTKGPPTVDSQAANGIERFAANLNAAINPHGYETEFHFEFVDDAHFKAEGGFASAATRTTASSEIGDGLKALSVNQGIAGLEVGTTYHYRAVATSPRGEAKGPEQTFTTLPTAVYGRQWAYARLKSATLEAEINPLGLQTGCTAQVVGEAQFQQSGYAGATNVPCSRDAGDGIGKATVKAVVDGLEVDSKYHYRFLASNTSGNLLSGDDSFETWGIKSFTVEVLDENGDPYTQAGGHPFESVTHYGFRHTKVAAGESGEEGALDAFVKNVLTESPPGRIGGTTATPRCLGYVAELENCSGDSQVGNITIEYFENGNIETRTRALFNVYAPNGVASRFSSIDPYTQTDAHIRTGGDYGGTGGSFNITEEARIVGVTARVWGVPADPRHDSERRCPGIGTGCASKAPPKAQLRNPTQCAGPLPSVGHVDTYQAPGEYASALTHTPPITGCDKLKFEPTISAKPTTSVADSPSGLNVDIHIPQDEDPTHLAVADLRDTTVLPAKGLIINPAAADGLVGCTPAQIELNGPAASRCPNASKVGTVEVQTALLDHPLHGGIYVAQPHDNPFDTLLAIYVAVDDPLTGVVVKLAGRVDADSGNGQLTTGFRDNPQMPFEHLRLRFFGGPRAILRTPVSCGTFTTQSVLTPYSWPHSGPPATPSDQYVIDAGPNGAPCVGEDSQAPARVRFKAGTADPTAAAFAPFTMALERDDGTQELAGLTMKPPPGLLGRLAGIPYCSEEALARAASREGVAEERQPSCPGASRVGSVATTVGAGTHPYRVPGTLYLAGPYKGADLSLAAVVPAVAGPYDLGTQVVRAALDLDLESAEIEVRSDPFPTILEGISLDVRSIRVNLDRPGFTLNPSSCRVKSVGGEVTSVFGQKLSLAERFQVGGCQRLRFKPRLGMRLRGKVRRGAHPSLRTVLKMPPGANISRASVTLPRSQFLDNEHIRDVCTRPQFAAGDCPPGSVYGRAKAWTPLLDEPLEGNVYLRSSTHRLPDLVADLNGQVRFALVGRIDSASGGIRVNIEGVPDAPVSKFMLTMRGGARSLLQNSVNVCRSPQRARVEFEAQNGKVEVLRPRLRPQCGGDGRR